MKAGGRIDFDWMAEVWRAGDEAQAELARSPRATPGLSVRGCLRLTQERLEALAKEPPSRARTASRDWIKVRCGRCGACPEMRPR